MGGRKQALSSLLFIVATIRKLQGLQVRDLSPSQRGIGVQAQLKLAFSQ